MTDEQASLINLRIDWPNELGDAITQVRSLQSQGLDYTIIAEINASNSAFPREIYRFLRDILGATRIALAIVPDSARSVSAEQFAGFLVGVYDEWVRYDWGGS